MEVGKDITGGAKTITFVAGPPPPAGSTRTGAESKGTFRLNITIYTKKKRNETKTKTGLAGRLPRPTAKSLFPGAAVRPRWIDQLFHRLNDGMINRKRR